ncbi:MAG TPA: zinc ribbon domain-containing protein [Desulfomonilaceae bacterium]|nr:zinc ribbon domain-containing protein [Desulfomonilaceae bacterium]
MDANNNLICDKCHTDLREGDPFCLNCGKLVPNVLSTGNLAVEVRDVPSERIRSQVLAELKKLFPSIDSIAAETRLRAGPLILLAGIDQESGNRLLEKLKSIKVDGRLVPQTGDDSWRRYFWNAGFPFGAVLLILGALLQGTVGLIVFMLGLACPTAWSMWKRARQKPLVTDVETNPNAGQWIDLSNQYSQLIAKLEAQDADSLRSLTATVFDLQRSLRSHSLVSVAAGEDRGDLYKTLTNVVTTGIDLCRRIVSAQGESRDLRRSELQDLSALLKKTQTRLRELDKEDVRSVGALEQDISRTIESIDRIVQDVRSPLTQETLIPEKTHL